MPLTLPKFIKIENLFIAYVFLHCSYGFYILMTKLNESQNFKKDFMNLKIYEKIGLAGTIWIIPIGVMIGLHFGEDG